MQGQKEVAKVESMDHQQHHHLLMMMTQLKEQIKQIEQDHFIKMQKIGIGMY